MSHAEVIKNMFAGRYAILETLESGGSSSVFKVCSTSGTEYALKLVTHQTIAEEAQQEIAVLRKLGQLRDWGQFITPDQQKRVGIVMTLFTGATLNWHLAEVKNYSLTTRLELMLQMIKEVKRLHNAKVIHGDVSPGNFIFNPFTRNLHIIDFTWSRIIQGTFQDGHFGYYWGWRWFNVPEYEHYKGLEGGSLTVRPDADIYQLGHSMLYLLGKADQLRFQAQPTVLDYPPIENLIDEMTASDPNLRPTIDIVASRCEYLIRQLSIEPDSEAAATATLNASAVADSDQPVSTIRPNKLHCT